MKRVIDVGLAACMLLAACPVFLLAALWIKCFSSGPVFFWSLRVGRRNELFSMPKFRTMRTDTPQLPTRLLVNADRWMIPGGRFLRSSSIDELPQLWSILKGDMSFVGPRPVIPAEDDLISSRTEQGVHEALPGLTGWAQVNGRDELDVPEKVGFDAYYVHNQSLWLDIHIIAVTVVRVLRRDGFAQAGDVPATARPAAGRLATERISTDLLGKDRPSIQLSGSVRFEHALTERRVA